MTTKITEKNISNIANSAVQWQAVITADGSTASTAVAGEGYFIDNSSATHTINLPASPSAGDTVKIVLLGDGNTNNVTIGRNGSNIQGSASDRTMTQNNQSETLVYSNATEGWAVTTSTVDPPAFISATGGTETTSGSYKIHTFTSTGCFTISCMGNQTTDVSYLVVAGGASGGSNNSGGGGAGGYREGKSSSDTYTASPLATSGITVTATTYPITVGGGGAGSPQPTNAGNDGSNSVFSTITSAGGGGGGAHSGVPARTGGSGGGGTIGPTNPGTNAGAAGNTPPVSPPQGNPGGFGSYQPSSNSGGGGGGAGGAGGNSTAPLGSGNAAGGGGVGTPTTISGTATSYAGGGGGGAGSTCFGGAASPCGTGGFGSGNPSVPNVNPPALPQGSAQAGATNRGGGGGGINHSTPGVSGAGGSGIVIIRYKYQ